MSAFLPPNSPGADTDPDHPRLQERPRSQAEEKARWEVRAAQWRARELAEAVFGAVSDTALSAVRSAGPLRGLMQLHVPFHDLDVHRAREARFMAAVEADPLLSEVPLVYVFGPDPG